VSSPTTVHGVRLTNPDRVLYAEQGITKVELAEYYASIAEQVLDELRDRPLTLLRCPQGSEKECFVQRRATGAIPPSVHRVVVEVSGEERTEHLAVSSLKGLLGLVQLGVLELHTWGARRDRLDRPDRLVMDLDPAPKLPFGRVVEAALEMREALRGLGLTSFVKTTGGKGLHVVAPLTRRNSWEEVRSASRALAERFAAQRPERYLSRASLAERTGRVFLDWMRNGPGATAIASYSTRARAGAPVSVPLTWEELDPAMDPTCWTVRTVPQRIAGMAREPWSGYSGLRQSLTREALRDLGVEPA
jgi:bifunctional non-homologous end joining protein LigD